MTPEELMKAVDLTEDEYIDEAAVPPVKHGVFALHGIKTVLAAAACLAAFLISGSILGKVAPPANITPDTTDDPLCDSTVPGTTADNMTETTQKSTEPTEKQTEPTTQEPTADVTQEPTAENNAPTIPVPPVDEPVTEQPAEMTSETPPEETTDATPPREPESEHETEAPPELKTLTDIMLELGLLSESPAGESGWLLGGTEVPGEEGEAPVITELSEEEATGLQGLPAPGNILLPEGFAFEEFYALAVSAKGLQAINARYFFRSETDMVSVMVQKQDGFLLPEATRELKTINIKGITVYYANNEMCLCDEINDRLAVFLLNDAFYAVLGSGAQLDSDRFFSVVESFIGVI